MVTLRRELVVSQTKPVWTTIQSTMLLNRLQGANKKENKMQLHFLKIDWDIEEKKNTFKRSCHLNIDSLLTGTIL